MSPKGPTLYSLWNYHFVAVPLFYCPLLRSSRPKRENWNTGQGINTKVYIKDRRLNVKWCQFWIKVKVLFTRETRTNCLYTKLLTMSKWVSSEQNQLPLLPSPFFLTKLSGVIKKNNVSNRLLLLWVTVL